MIKGKWHQRHASNGRTRRQIKYRIEAILEMRFDRRSGKGDAESTKRSLFLIMRPKWELFNDADNAEATFSSENLE